MECPGCGNQVAGNARSCDACGGALPASEAAPAVNDQRGWGTETRSFDCEGCGAQTVFSASQMTLECPYCGSQKVVELSASETAQVVQPDFVVPFKVEKGRSSELFQAWVTGLWFAPGDLKERASADHVKGVYLPFWSFDVETSTWCSGQVGFHYKEKGSDGQEQTKTRWERGSGWHNGDYDDVLVCASKGVERGLIEAIEPWDLKERQPYAPKYLAGWEAERYAFDADQAWKDRGKERVRERELSECRSSLRKKYGAAEVKDLQVEVRYRNLASRHLLLPVYISAFSYQDKTYRFMINGQTGEVQGERPWSAGKLAGLVVGILAVLGLLIALAGGRGAEKPPQPPAPAPSASESPAGD